MYFRYFDGQYIYSISGWTAVKQGEKIPWDLEGTPIQIKTESTLGSGEQVYLKVWSESGGLSQSISVKFASSVQYFILYCASGHVDLPVQPPVAVNKIWKFTKTTSALIITCNNVEVLNYQYTDSPYNGCNSRWAIDVDVEQIEFTTSDTASEFYFVGKGIRHEMCPSF